MKNPHYLGRGWPFPPAPAHGRIDYVDGPDKVAASIQLLLATEPGERVMRPAFGCGLRHFLMAPNSEATRALIGHEVLRALEAHEPRIAVEAVQVVADADEPTRVDITITYVHVRDRRPGTLIYPFYLE